MVKNLVKTIGHKNLIKKLGHENLVNLVLIGHFRPNMIKVSNVFQAQFQILVPLNRNLYSNISYPDFCESFDSREFSEFDFCLIT